MAAYQAALAATPIPVGASKRSKPGSVSAAIAEFYGSQSFRNLTGGSPVLRRAILERFREKHGHMPLASLPQAFIVALLDTMPAHAALNWLKAFRHFFRWCVTRKLVRNDPTLGIRLKVPKSDGFHTWTEQEIAQFEAHWPIGSKPRLAFALGLYTAQRRGDVVRIGRQHIKDGVLAVRQQKTGATGDSRPSRPCSNHCGNAGRPSHLANNKERQELRRERLQRDIPVVVRCRPAAAALRLSWAPQGGMRAPSRCRMYRA
jgi:integrase